MIASETKHRNELHEREVLYWAAMSKSWVEDLLYRFLGPETKPGDYRHERRVAEEVIKKCAQLAEESGNHELAMQIVKLLKA